MVRQLFSGAHTESWLKEVKTSGVEEPEGLALGEGVEDAETAETRSHTPAGADGAMPELTKPIVILARDTAVGEADAAYEALDEV